MKLAAFFVGIILFFASCKNDASTETIPDTNITLVDHNSSALYAQIGFENRVIDLGKLVPFSNNHVIHFTNEGDTTLIINDVYTEGKRIEIHGFTYEIEPKAQGKIRLRFDQSLEHTSFSDYIFVRTNDNNKPTLARLEVQYEVSDQLVIGGSFVEEGDRINVRMFPSLDATVLFGLDKGDSIKCVGAMYKEYVEDFDSNLWYYVDYNGRKGWVLSALTDFKETEVVALIE